MWNPNHLHNSTGLLRTLPRLAKAYRKRIAEGGLVGAPTYAAKSSDGVHGMRQRIGWDWNTTQRCGNNAVLLIPKCYHNVTGIMLPIFFVTLSVYA